MPSKARSTLALTAVVALLGVAGCGGDDDDSDGAGGGNGGSASTTGGGGGGGGGGKATTLKISADPNGDLKFDKSSLTANAGKVTIVMDNPSTATQPHAVEIEGNGVEVEGETVQPGEGKSTASADLKAGDYEFYCPVDGHKAAGMEGTLTVS